jgi:NADP-dependent 3-hydroxy acid dehydrogenase YdfG
MDNILIAGAASGIGATTARLFHAHGWQVGLLDRNAEGLASLAAELGAAWQGAVDVTDADAVQQALTAFCANLAMTSFLLVRG